MTFALQTELRDKVREAYSAAAWDSQAPHSFPVGRACAKSLGYPPELLDEVSASATEAFAGVSCVSLLVAMEPGMRVLDLGCGAGLDTVIAARRGGAAGRVTGVDSARRCSNVPGGPCGKPAAGFRDARLLRAARNAGTRDPWALAAEVIARR